MSPDPRRILLVGAGGHDMVADCYRRTLAPHYDTALFDPFDSFPPLSRILGPARASNLSSAMQTVSRIVTREPLSTSLGPLRKIAARFAPDLVLVTCIDALPPAAVAHLRGGNTKARIIGIFSDAISNFGRGYFFNADYDALFFKDHYIVEKLRAKLGWRHVYYLPQACDPALHHPVPLTAEDRRIYGCDLTVAGNPHAFRAAQLQLLDGRDIKLWGGLPPMWLQHPIFRHHQHRYVTGLEKCKAMTAAKIVLNANHYAEIQGTNKRTFEVAAMGAFQLTDTPALADVFVPDVEVATFTTASDLLEKIDFYLAHPAVRDEMAERARNRAHAEHTYAHRWTAHLSVLGLDVPESFPVKEHQVRCVPQ